MSMNKIKQICSLTIFFSLLLVLAACGSANSDISMSSLKMSDTENKNLVTTSTSYSSDTATETAAQSTSTSSSLLQQMLIYKGELNISTDYFDDTFDVIKSSLTTANGYIVSQEDRSGDFANRYTTLQVRIPSQHFFTWVEGIEALPNTKISKHIYTEDVSEEYVDLKAREKAKQVVIDKYIEYMKLATTADELIRYTNELAHLQEEIESVQARIRYLNNQVSYSTVTLVLKETKESSFLSELQIGSQLKHAFESGFSGSVSVFAFLITSVIVLIPCILFGLCIWAIVYFISRYYKRNAAKRIINKPYIQQQNHSNQDNVDNHSSNDGRDSNNGNQK